MSIKEELEAADKELTLQKKYVIERMSTLRHSHLCQYDKETIKLAMDLIRRL